MHRSATRRQRLWPLLVLRPQVLTLATKASCGIGMLLAWPPDSRRPLPTRRDPPIQACFLSEHFRLDVIVVEQECFGSAGCRVVYTLKPIYVGPGSLSGTSFTVVFLISGGEEPQVGHFTVTNGTATVDHETMIHTSSASSILTATATQILPYEPNSYSYSISLT